MYQEEIKKLLSAGLAKWSLFRNHPGGFFLSSILAGLYIGFGICFVYSIAGCMEGFIGLKVLMGFCFSVALSLVVIAGAELFTGNSLFMPIALAKRRITFKGFMAFMGYCWLGNLVGSLLCALLFSGGGFLTPSVQEAIHQAALVKTGLPLFPLLCRGILCNILVCLAIWSCNRILDGGGKLLMIILCIACFFISGYEHSIANMTLFFLSALSESTLTLPLGAYIYNLLVVTFGNFLGAAGLVALPYLYISDKSQV